MKRFLILGFALLFAPALQGASSRAVYRIALRNGGSVTSRDLPVHRGSVVLFHQEPGGALTGLPEEDVVGVQTDSSSVTVRKQVMVRSRPDAVIRSRVSAIQTLAQPLQPGDILILGPTGSGSAQVAGQTGYGAAGASMSGVNNGYGANAGTGAYGGGTVPPGFAPNGQPFVPAPGDTARVPSAGAPPTMGPNGFPLTGNATTVQTGPNGTPIVVQPGTATGQPVTGPNGTPVLAQPGTPGAAPPMIGPNGTPVLAPSGAPGSSPPAIGPNGTPATGPAGTASSAQPNTASNGTPASPPHP